MLGRRNLLSKTILSARLELFGKDYVYKTSNWVVLLALDQKSLRGSPWWPSIYPRMQNSNFDELGDVGEDLLI